MFKFSIHSIVDVITNSSTVIYTWQDSISEAKELLQEVLKLSGVEKNVDDLFCFGVFLSDNDDYAEMLNDASPDEISEFPADWPEGYEAQDDYLESLKERVMKGETVKPRWMDDLEKGDGYDFALSTSLHIISKKETYKPIIDKMIRFLNSPNCDGRL
jgi:hypothetical protein